VVLLKAEAGLWPVRPKLEVRLGVAGARTGVDALRRGLAPCLLAGRVLEGRHIIIVFILMQGWQSRCIAYKAAQCAQMVPHQRQHTIHIHEPSAEQALHLSLAANLQART
jgi:hypothetical protein